MFALSPRSLLPAAGLFAAAFCLVGAVTAEPDATPARPPRVSHVDLVQAEARLCEARGDRSPEQCLDEAQGKALIRHAEWLARNDDRAPADADAALAEAQQPGVARRHRVVAQ